MKVPDEIGTLGLIVIFTWKGLSNLLLDLSENLQFYICEAFSCQYDYILTCQYGEPFALWLATLSRWQINAILKVLNCKCKLNTLSSINKKMINYTDCKEE